MSVAHLGGALTSPRVRILSGDTVLPGVISAEVTQTDAYQADRFRLEIDAEPAGGIAWWSGRDSIPVQIDVRDGSDGAWTTLVSGTVDHVSVHPGPGLVVLDGRDKTAALIDARTQNAYQNQTSSEIVTAIAKAHGLTPVVTATTALVDRYYESDHTQIALGQFSRVSTEWALITYLAQREGFDAFVSGDELHFQPRASDTAGPFYPITWTPPGPAAYAKSSVLELRMERALTLAGDIEVKVRSWHSGKRTGFTKTVRRTGGGRSAAGLQTYVFQVPNLTEDAALQRATAILTDLSDHERTITFRQPLDLALTCRSVIKLSGTGTDWDIAFYPASITTSITFDGGAVQDVRAKNVSPGSQVQVS